MSIYLEPILDPITSEYINVLTTDRIPEGPLGKRVKLVRTSDLSEFKQRVAQNNCKCIFMKEDMRCYMEKRDIPELFSLLRANGYTIDLGLTKLYKSSTPNCVCIYGGPSPL